MSSKFSSKIIEHSNVCADLTVASYWQISNQNKLIETQLLDLRRTRGKFNSFNMLFCSYSIRKITFQGLKVSNQGKASKSRNQTKTPVLTYLSRVAHSPGFAFILSLLYTPMCLFLVLGKVIRQHEAISVVFLLVEFRFSNFRTFETQIVLIFLTLQQISLPFFIFWKLTEKSLLFYKS